MHYRRTLAALSLVCCCLSWALHLKPQFLSGVSRRNGATHRCSADRLKRRRPRECRAALYCSAGESGEDAQTPPRRLPADPARDGEGETPLSELSNADIAALLGRVKALREKDVQDDQSCAANWRRGEMTHSVLVRADAHIQHLRLCGQQLAFGTVEGDCYVVELGSGAVLNAFEGHDGELTALHFDGELLITGGADKTVKVLRVDRRGAEAGEPGECMYTLHGHTERVMGVARVGRRRVVSGSLDGKVMFWDLGGGSDGSGGSNTSSGSSGRTEEGKNSNSASSEASESGVDAEASDSATNAKTGGGDSSSGRRPAVTLRTYIAGSPVLCLGASDGFVAVGLMSGAVVILDGETGRPLLSFRAHPGAVRSLYFPGKEVLVTGGGDGTVSFWDLVNGGAALDNKYEVEGRWLTHSFIGHDAPIVAIACDLTKLVSASVDGVVRVWDMRSGTELFRVEGHSPAIRSVQFTRRLLVTDGTLDCIVGHDFSGEESSGDGEPEIFISGDDDNDD